MGKFTHPKPGIRYSASLSKSLKEQQPLMDYDPDNSQLENFEELAAIVANGGARETITDANPFRTIWAKPRTMSSNPLKISRPATGPRVVRLRLRLGTVVRTIPKFVNAPSTPVVRRGRIRGRDWNLRRPRTSTTGYPRRREARSSPSPSSHSQRKSRNDSSNSSPGDDETIRRSLLAFNRNVTGVRIQAGNCAIGRLVRFLRFESVVRRCCTLGPHRLRREADFVE